MRRYLSVLLVLPLLVGCGKSGSSAGSKDSKDTKAEYVAAANRICADVAHSIEAQPDPKGPADFAAMLDGIVTILEDGQRELRELTPPADDAADIEEHLIKPNQEQIDLIHEVLPELKALAKEANPLQAVQKFTETLKQFGEIGDAQDDWAKSYGLDQCAA